MLQIECRKLYLLESISSRVTLKPIHNSMPLPWLKMLLVSTASHNSGSVIFLQTTLYFIWICRKTTGSSKMKFGQKFVKALAIKFCEKNCSSAFRIFYSFILKLLKSKNCDNFRLGVIFGHL